MSPKEIEKEREREDAEIKTDGCDCHKKVHYYIEEYCVPLILVVGIRQICFSWKWFQEIEKFTRVESKDVKKKLIHHVERSGPSVFSKQNTNVIIITIINNKE